MAFQKRSNFVDARQDTCRARKRFRATIEQSGRGKTLAIECPCCRCGKLSSEWHFMDHFAKRHYKNCQGGELDNNCGKPLPNVSRDFFCKKVRLLFDKYNHTRKALGESPVFRSFGTCAKVWCLNDSYRIKLSLFRSTYIDYNWVNMGNNGQKSAWIFSNSASLDYITLAMFLLHLFCT